MEEALAAFDAISIPAPQVSATSTSTSIAKTLPFFAPPTIEPAAPAVGTAFQY